MGILSWIVVGLIAGFLAGLVVKGSGFGLFWNIIIGVIGGLLGGWVGQSLLGIDAAVTGINWTSILVAFLGAVLLLLIVNLFRHGRTQA
jgi:uncharacterized membrane protein YeaQ/YmgE (transglycosylase-associated protein family)